MGKDLRKYSQAPGKSVVEKSTTREARQIAAPELCGAKFPELMQV